MLVVKVLHSYDQGESKAHHYSVGGSSWKKSEKSESHFDHCVALLLSTLKGDIYFGIIRMPGKKCGSRLQTVGGSVTVMNKYRARAGETDLTGKLQEFSQDWAGLAKTENIDVTSADYYFNSYAHFGIHDEMLKDSVRTGAYQRAIMNNPHLFKDKIVLDVGAGTGVLSMFAAKAGAKHVYAIECSEIVHVARKVIEANNLSDKITLVHAKAEDANLPVDFVDIIISEWMGYFLLYESMLDTVIYCRDRYLRKGGLIFPDKATIHIAALEDSEYMKEKFDFWDNCYGLDYSCVKKLLYEEPTVDVVQQENIPTDSCCILELDLNTCTVQDVDFTAPFRIRFEKKDYADAFVRQTLHTFRISHTAVFAFHFLAQRSSFVCRSHGSIARSRHAMFPLPFLRDLSLITRIGDRPFFICRSALPPTEGVSISSHMIIYALV